MTALVDAFKEMWAVCRPRPDQDEGTLEAAARRLWRTLGEYREGVALAALDRWPKQNDWYPTEKELRDLLDRLSLDADRETPRGERTAKGRFSNPVGDTAYFWKRVAQVRGQRYAESWLWGGVTAEFTATNVYVNQVGHDYLMRDCGNLVAECGVNIVVDNEVALLLQKYIAENDIGAYEAPRRRRG